MDLATINKALTAGAATSTLVAALTAFTDLLPPGSPWFAYPITIAAAGVAIGFLVWVVPNKPA
jgi:hypothetical protein